jgi:putative acetyltransferase
MYPKAIDKEKIGTYPARSFSGGGYFYDEILEYRVWVHPGDGEEDYYYPFYEFEEALKFSNETANAENPCVLILQKEYIDEPEDGVYIKMCKERITEWLVEWLLDSKREEGSIDSFIETHNSQ